MQASKPQNVLINNTDERIPFLAMCHLCGSVFYFEDGFNRHTSACHEKFENGKCGWFDCPQESTFTETKINLCWDHYYCCLESSNISEQKEYVLTTFRDGYLPKCKRCHIKKVFKTAILAERKALCLECFIKDMKEREQEEELKIHQRFLGKKREPEIEIDDAEQEEEFRRLDGLAPRVLVPNYRAIREFIDDEALDGDEESKRALDRRLERNMRRDPDDSP